MDNLNENEIVLADIKSKEELCAKAKAIAESNDLKDGALRISNLFNEWKNIRNHHTEREDELWADFQASRAKYKKAREDQRDCNKKEKETIIAEADKLLSCENFKEAAAALDELMTKWKNTGSAGHDEDERLWNLFKEKRQAFRALRQKFFDEQAAFQQKNAEKKRELINVAKGITDGVITDWKAAADTMAQLMDQWKNTGFAGRENNDTLWDEFNTIRKTFFDKRQEAYNANDENRAKVAEEKLALIEEAKRIAALEDYSSDNAKLMKELDVKWKAAGSAGREKENELWDAFKEAKEAFWTERQKIVDEKQQEWAVKKKDIIKNKKKQIDSLYDQITSLNKSIKGSMDWIRIEKVRGWIEEKTARIETLKKDIKNLEQ